jgi:hypothetical protein
MARSPQVPRTAARLAVVVSSLVSAGACCAAGSIAAGRWEGIVDIPGAPMPLAVDLAPDAHGQWHGSIVMPGRGVAGAELGSLSVGDRDVAFTFGAALPFPVDPAPRMTLTAQGSDTLAGRMELSGNSAAVTLHRTEPPQVSAPVATHVISAALEGTWHGRYELGGYARDVTVTLANNASGPAGGQLVVVGKRTTKLDVDQIVQGRQFVSMHASAADFGIEGRFDAEAGTITGSMSQGPYEAPIVLHRDAAAKEKAS